MPGKRNLRSRNAPCERDVDLCDEQHVCRKVLGCEPWEMLARIGVGQRCCESQAGQHAAPKRGVWHHRHPQFGRGREHVLFDIAREDRTPLNAKLRFQCHGPLHVLVGNAGLKVYGSG